MYKRYSLNHGNCKLHIESCRHAKEVFHDERDYSLDDLLADVDRKVTYCKLCLKNDKIAQEKVEAHNRRLKL